MSRSAFLPTASTAIGAAFVTCFSMPPDAGRVWVTRTAPFNQLTAKRLAAIGYETLLMPALRVVPVAMHVPVAVPDALIFTSLNGIRLHRFLPALADRQVFAVGDHSARFARAIGYRRVMSASGNVSDLAKLIVAQCVPGSTVLHIGAVQPAGDLEVLLAAGGVRLRRHPVYDVVESNLAGMRRVVASPAGLAAALIHSPRAGAHVAAWLDRRQPAWRGAVVCISEAAASSFRNGRGLDIKVAKRPDEASMLACLGMSGTDRS